MVAVKKSARVMKLLICSSSFAIDRISEKTEKKCFLCLNQYLILLQAYTGSEKVIF